MDGYYVSNVLPLIRCQRLLLMLHPSISILFFLSIHGVIFIYLSLVAPFQLVCNYGNIATLNIVSILFHSIQSQSVLFPSLMFALCYWFGLCYCCYIVFMFTVIFFALFGFLHSNVCFFNSIFYCDAKAEHRFHLYGSAESRIAAAAAVSLCFCFVCLFAMWVCIHCFPKFLFMPIRYVHNPEITVDLYLFGFFDLTSKIMITKKKTHTRHKNTRMQ